MNFYTVHLESKLTIPASVLSYSPLLSSKHWISRGKIFFPCWRCDTVLRISRYTILFTVLYPHSNKKILPSFLLSWLIFIFIILFFTLPTHILQYLNSQKNHHPTSPFPEHVTLVNIQWDADGQWLLHLQLYSNLLFLFTLYCMNRTLKKVFSRPNLRLNICKTNKKSVMSTQLAKSC